MRTLAWEAIAAASRALARGCLVLAGVAWAAGPSLGQPAGDTSPAPWGGVASLGGGFRVTPTRIVFADRLRSAELTIVNTGPRTATYRIALVRMRMAEDGGIAEVADALPGEA